MTYSDTVTEQMRAYYTQLYRDELGLPGWKTKVEARLAEDENFSGHIKKIEMWSGFCFDAPQKVLIVGGGTGAEFIALSLRGCEVYAVEPNPAAIKISRLKALERGIEPEKFREGVGENLPFEDNFFDFIWCWTVLEHVQNVEATVQEMIRTVKPGGRILIHTPNYRQFYEPHYKLTLPMFLPKRLLTVWLRLLGRPTRYFNSIQFVNSHQLTRIFQKYPVYAHYVLEPRPTVTPQTLQERLVNFMRDYLAVQRDQYWILHKIG